MKYTVVLLSLYIVIGFFIFPWFDCSLPGTDISRPTGAQLVLNMDHLNRLVNPCAPESSGAVMLLGFFLLIFLILVGAFLTGFQAQGPTWYWIGAFFGSIASLVLAFIGTMDVLTESFRMALNISFIDNILLVIITLAGWVMSRKKAPASA